MGWLTLHEAIDALRQHLRALETMTPNAVEQIVTAWQQELRRQEHIPGELWKRWQCASCNNVVPQTYVVDHLSNPIKILCPICWLDTVPDHELALYFGEITQRVYRRMLWPGSIDYTPPGEPLLLDEEDDEEDEDDF